MMKRIYLLLVFFTTINCFSQLNTLHVLDSLTNAKIEFVAVDFLDNSGVFTDKTGAFKINLNTQKKIKLTHALYVQKIINLTNTDSIVFLTPKINEIEKIIIDSKKTSKKYIFKKLNDKIATDKFAGFGAYGFQFINIIKPLDSIKNYFIDGLQIPVYLNQKSKYINNTKVNGLVRITFHHIINNKPSDSIIGEINYSVINHKVLSKNILKIDLKKKVNIPLEGMFCMVTMLGECTEKGDLIIENLYDYVTINETKKYYLKSLPFTVPLLESNEAEVTKCRLLFNTGSDFNKINIPYTISKDLSEEDKKKFLQLKNSNSKENFHVPFGVNYLYYE